MQAVSLLIVSLEGQLAGWIGRVGAIQWRTSHVSQALGSTEVSSNKAVQVRLGWTWVENGEGGGGVVGNLRGLTVGGLNTEDGGGLLGGAAIHEVRWGHL